MHTYSLYTDRFSCPSHICENTPRGGRIGKLANLKTNDVELKINFNTLCVTKECSRIPDEGLWTISSRFLKIRVEVLYEVLAQRLITLVLMMINSCSYSTNDLVFN